MAHKEIAGEGIDESVIDGQVSTRTGACDNTAYDERQPKCIRLEQRADGMLMTYRWYSPFAIVGVLGPLGIIAISAPGAMGMWNNVAPFFILFYSFVGIFLYSGLAHVVNRTEIKLSAEGLRIVNRPLLWPGRKRVPASELAQLYVDEYYTRTRHGSILHYRLNGILRDGKKIVLINSFQHPDPQIGKFMESMIENYLMIRDEPMAGELKKNRA